MGTPIKQHIPCPSCGSSDAATLYRGDRDGKEYLKCFSCDEVMFDNDNKEPFDYGDDAQPSEDATGVAPSLDIRVIEEPNFHGRGIRPEAWDAYECGTDPTGTFRYFPVFDSETGTKLVAFKRKHITEKNYQKWIGSPKGAGLFGAHKWRSGGKRLTITEGEEDCLAAFQMNGMKYPVVSLTHGANSVKSLSRSDFDFFLKFEQIVLCFDNDEQGKKAVEQIAKLFPKPPLVMSLTLKDANEYLKAGKEDEFRRAFWDAKPYRPSKLVLSSETFDYIKDDETKPIGTYPWDGMNEKSWGIFPGQAIVLTAGSGLGKSFISKVFLKHLYDTTSAKIGCLILEESVGEAVRTITSMELERNLNNPLISQDTPLEDRQKAWARLFADDRWMFLDHFGSAPIEEILEYIRYLAVSFGATYILLDHISIVVSDQESGDERKTLDRVMTKIATIAKELGIVIFVVVHLSRGDGKAHEEGGKVSANQIRGTNAILQLGHAVWGLERNGQDEDELKRNLTMVRALKLRKSGLTGPCAYLLYDPDKACLTELAKDDLERHLAEEAERRRAIRREVAAREMDAQFAQGEARIR